MAIGSRVRIRRIRAAGLVAVAAALIAIVPGAFTAANAADNEPWSVSPTTFSGDLTARSSFQPILVPRVQVQDSITLTNRSDAPIDFDLRAVDAFNRRDGSYAFRRPTDPKMDMGAWIHLSTDQVTVPAGSAAVVPFTIDPPIDATPGDHPGGIVATPTTPVVDDRGQVGARVYGRVEGPSSPHLDVTAMQISTDTGAESRFGGGADAEIRYRVTNTGNIQLDPVAHLSVRPLLGGEHELAARRLPHLLPGGSAVVHQKVDDLRPWGRLVASLKVTSGASGTADANANAEATAWVIPWGLILLVLLIVGGVVGVLRRRRRRRRETPREDRGGSVRPARALVLSGAVVLGVFSAFPATPIAAQPAPKPSIEASSHTLEPGTTVAIGGAHWPEGSTLQASLCGNRALDGSANCVADTAVTMTPGRDGVILGTLEVTTPPTPCPCVLFVNDLASNRQFRLPVDVLGAPVGPLERHLPSRAANTITTRATVESTSSVGALFGGAADRTLVLELHNTSDVAVRQMPVAAAWGRDDGDHPIPSRSVTLPPHGTVTIRLPFELDPGSVGGYDVAGTAGVAGNQATFTSRTSQWPWGLLVILVLVAVGLVVLVVRAWRRRHRAEPEPVAAAVEQPEPVPVQEPEPIVLEEPEPIWLEEPEPIWLEEPEPIWSEEPDEIWLEEPDEIWLEEPEPIWLDGPEPISLEEPEPISWAWISWSPDRDEPAGATSAASEASEGAPTPTRR